MIHYNLYRDHTVVLVWASCSDGNILSSRLNFARAQYLVELSIAHAI